MTLTMTVSNADTSLIDALKSVIKLSPKAKVSFEETSQLEDELLSERDEIRTKIADGTLQTYSNMEEYRRSHAL